MNKICEHFWQRLLELKTPTDRKKHQQISFACLSEVGGEGFLSFLEGLDLAGGQGLEVGLLALQPGSLSADLPERRLLLWPPALADRHLCKCNNKTLNQTVLYIKSCFHERINVPSGKIPKIAFCLKMPFHIKVIQRASNSCCKCIQLKQANKALVVDIAGCCYGTNTVIIIHKISFVQKLYQNRTKKASCKCGCSNLILYGRFNILG